MMSRAEKRRFWGGLESCVELECDGSIARILPRQGANWCSWIVDGIEYMYGPQEQPGGRPEVRGFGCPVLFPTPNRVTDCEFTYDGRVYPQHKLGVPRDIHGLVYDEKWRVEALENGNGWAQATMRLDITPSAHIYDSFPFDCILRLVFRLERQKMTLTYILSNTGGMVLPFGFAIHPFFLYVDQRKDCRLRVNAPQTYEAIECFPTGKLLDVAGTKRDLRTMRALDEVDVDDVYYPIMPDTAVEAQFVKSGKKLSFSATEEFKRLVVYTPQERGFFCIENQTCSTDAHNLDAKGLGDIAGLMRLAPGCVHSGRIEMEINNI